MDVKKVLQGAGIGDEFSSCYGENRAELAIEAALNSPLLNNRDIGGLNESLSRWHPAKMRNLWLLWTNKWPLPITLKPDW
jgi:cell division protein FtsZ